MGAAKQNPLVSVYSNRIGKPSTADEAFGYWVFVIGVLAGLVGIILVLMSESPGQTIRGAGIALAALGLLLLMIGPTIRLPLRRSATIISYLGMAIGLAGIAWFLTDFTAGDWGAAFANNEVLIMATYSVGILAIAVGSMFIPLLASPRERQEAAESERDEALEELSRKKKEAEQRAEEAEQQRKEAERLAEEAASERSQREILALELQRIEDSQSQFELYTDTAGKHRWRLRHRNRNIIADSAQGYSSRQKAQQGLSAVKRDAFGAGVVDLDKVEGVEVEEVDDAVEGDAAPAFVEEVESKATFEGYEDSGGKHRWRLVHDNGNIIADSGEGYSSSSGRDDAVDRVRHYVQAADYLKLDPAAFELYQDKGGKYRWRLLHKNGNVIADSGQGYASRQKARQGIDSVQSNAGGGGSAEFEVYEDNAGEYRWRLVHSNGNIIADGGEGYASEGGAEDAVERVREYAPEGHVLDIGSAAFELYEDSGEEWRWRLRHRNGNIMADSGEGYAARGGAEDGIHSVKHNAPNAELEHVDS